MFDLGFLSNVTYTLDSENKTFNQIYLYFQLGLSALTFLFIPFALPLPYLAFKFPQFHINLLLLFGNLGACYACLTIGRQITFFKVYFCREKVDCYFSELFMIRTALFPEYLKYASVVAYFVASNWIILERVWAIIYLKGYENKKDYKFIICAIVFQWVISAGGYWFTHMGYLPNSLFILLGLLMTFGNFFLFRFMDNKNSRRYRLSKSVGNAYTLTERYQLAENIKTSPLIRSTTNFHIFMHPTLLLTFAFLYYSETVLQKQIAKMFFDFLLTIYCPIYCLIIINAVEKWKYICLRPFVSSRVHKITPRNDNSSNNKNNAAANNHLIMTPQMETDIYFQQLSKFWN